MSDNINDLILEASERASQRAFEIAVRTGTALIFNRNGKTIRVKPPFRYELVSTKPEKKKRLGKSSRKTIE